mgnify:CR=1 FL=1
MEWNPKNIAFAIALFFYEIRRRYHCLLNQWFGPLCKVMICENQRCLELFLLELKGHGTNLLTDNNTTTQAQ